MSNLIFDLQRFAIVFNTNDGLVTVQPYTSETVAGAYYFDGAGKYNISSTFEGDVTISAEFDEVDGYYIITEVDSIALPGEGSGTITTGTGVGTSADNSVEITNLGNSMLTFGGTTLAFDTTDKNSAVHVYGGSHIAYVEIENGSFSAASATNLHVNDTYYSSAITIDKDFTYKAGNDPVITISETGANVAASDGATKIIAPAGQNNSITVLGTTLNYSSANAAAIAIDTENASVSGYTLSEIGDKVIVPAALAKNENFVLNGGNIDNSYLPATGYTIEKLDSGYFANGFNSGSLTLGEEYKLTNDSGSAAIALDKYGDIFAVILGTGDIFAPVSGGELSAVGDTITLYKDSLSAENKINISLTRASAVNVTRTDSGISIGNISGSEGDAITLGGVEFSYANKSGSAFYGDDGKISVNIASGNSEDNRGEIEVDGDPVEITFNDSAWLKVDNRGEAFLLTNTLNILEISDIREGAVIEATNIQVVAESTSLTINNYTISVPDSSYLEGDMVITVDENGEITQVVDSAYGNEIDYNIVDNSLVGKKVENSAANVSIIGTAGDDTISNEGENVLYKYAQGDGNDTIYGFNETSTLSISDTEYSTTKSGNDIVVTVGDGSITLKNVASLASVNIDGTEVSANPLLITLTEGNDSYSNTVNSATIQALGGDDTIQSWGNSVSIDGGTGHDYIYNSSLGTSVTIDGGADNDSIYNHASKVTIDGGDGDDTIDNWDNNVNNVTIDGGAGNDSINNIGSFVTISGGAGYDYIYNRGTNVTINGGDGDDTINNYGDNVTIDGGDGNDVIANSTSDSVSISGGAGNDYIRNEGLKVTIDAGAGDDSIENYGRNVTIDGGAGNDIVSNSGSSDIITTGTGDDSITNSGKSATIASGDGDDTISNYNDSVTIDGGAGNDFIWNVANNVTLNGGDGSDTIANSSGDRVSIDGGDGNDHIDSNGSNVTIDAGTGNDDIDNWNNNVTIDGGDGNDYIYNEGDSVTIDGGAGNDSISNGGNNVTIDAGAGNDSINNWNNNVTIDGGTGSNIIDLNSSIRSGVLVKVGDGSDVIKLGASVSAFSVAGFGADDEIQLAAAADNLKTITGGIAAGNVSISGIYDIATVKNSWNFSNNSVAYNRSTVAGAKLDGNKIIYDATTNTENLFTITGISSTDGVSLKGNVVTVSAAALSQGTVSISGGYTLVLGGDVTRSTVTAAGWSLNSSVATYKEAGTTAGYTLENGVIKYVAASGGNTLATVSGVTSTSGLEIDTTKKVVTVSTAALGQGTVSISGGYTLALGSNVTTTTTTAAGWSLNGTTATYKAKLTSAGYTLANNKITYSEASGGDTLITVNGIKSPLGLALKNKVVTVSAFALNQSEVSISEGYTLALGSDVDKPKTTAAGWSLSGTTATYKAKSTSAGYTLANNKITYSEASGGDTLITVNGVKSLNGLSLKNKVVTVSAAALDKDVVFLSGTGYTLALGSNVDKTKESVSKWSTLKGGNVAYLTGGTGAYYSLNAKKNAIIYNAAVAPDTKEIEFSGVKGTPTVSGSTVKLTAANFNSNVKLVKNADDYKLSLSGDFKNKTLTGSANADTITSGGSNLVINGGKGDDSITGGANVDKIAGDAGDDTLRGGKGNDSLNGGKGNDYLDGGDNNDKLLGETGDDTLVGGKGNDTFTGGKGDDVFIYSAGNDVITDFATGDKISIGAAIASTSIKGSDATFTISKNNTLTVKNGKGKEITVINAKGKEQTLIGGALIVSKSATLENWREVGDASALTKAVKVIGNAKANTLLGGSKNDTLSGAGGADKLLGNAGNDSLSGGAGADTLSGGAGNDKLLGGKGNDSLYGGKGNDSLWGDAGSDTFLYNNGDGKDIIYGFDNSDILEISGTFSGTTNKKKTEVYFKVGSTSNAITLKNFTAATFNINDTDYKISGTKLVKK